MSSGCRERFTNVLLSRHYDCLLSTTRLSSLIRRASLKRTRKKRKDRKRLLYTLESHLGGFPFSLFISADLFGRVDVAQRRSNLLIFNFPQWPIDSGFSSPVHHTRHWWCVIKQFTTPIILVPHPIPLPNNSIRNAVQFSANNRRPLIY